MKFLTLILFLFLANGCSKPGTSIEDYQLPLNGFQLGEYLQIDSPQSVVTVNRSAQRTGLVKIQLPNYEMTVLDPSAGEARDIFVSDHKIAYRVDGQIRLWNNTVIPIQTNAQKIRSFTWKKDYGRVSYDNLAKESRWITFREDGKVIADGALPGSARASVFMNELELIAIQNSDGFFIVRMGSEAEGVKEMNPIQRGATVGFASMRVFGDSLMIGFFDENEGVLKLAKQNSPALNFSIELVDGTPQQTYRGMDIAIFNDAGTPGFFYLDAWALKLRWARKLNGQWISDQIPIRGAVGFYNQIIDETAQTVTLGLHNFRSQIDDFNQTFENIAVLKMKLNR